MPRRRGAATICLIDTPSRVGVSLVCLYASPATHHLKQRHAMEPLGTWSQEPLPASPVSSGSGNGNCSSGSYSIKGEFAASTVFITGASGYIGSVLLEQLLRTTDVATIYLLLRPRRGQNIQERADKLLQGALFHKVGVCGCMDAQLQ